MLEESTLTGCLLSCLIFLMLNICSIKREQSLLSNNVSVWIHILILLFCAFAFWNTDYYHYRETLDTINSHYSYDDQYTHMENIYMWIYDVCGRYYTLFRVVVWGVAYLFFIIASKKLEIYNSLTVLLFTIIFLLTFSYARVSLGMASFFLGCILLFQKQSWLRNVIIAALLCVLSYFSHKSMIALLCLLPFSFIKYNKWLWLLVMAAVFFVANKYSDQITLLLFGSVDYMDETNDLYDTFASASTYGEAYLYQRVGMGELVQNMLQYSSIVVPLIMMLNKRIYTYLQSHIQCRVIYNVALLITIVAISLGILVSFSSPMCYRYLYMAYMPIVLLVSLLFKEKLVSTKQLYVILILGSLSAWYRLFYVVYNANIMS